MYKYPIRLHLILVPFLYEVAILVDKAYQSLDLLGIYEGRYLLVLSR